MLASGPVLGVVVGWALRGRIQRLADLRIQWWPLLAGAVSLRVFAGVLGDAAVLAYIVAFAAIVAVALANAGIKGMALVAAGGALNLAVVVANGGMPVDPTALAVAGASIPRDALHVPLSETTALALLADRLPMAVFRGVYSVGDVLLTAGGFWVPFAAMRE